jgi:hypothetical protein
MADERDTDDDFTNDIGFALWRSPFRIKRHQFGSLNRTMMPAPS